MDTNLKQVRTRIDELRVFESAESRRRFLVHVLVAVAVVVFVTVLLERYVGFLTDAARLRAFIRQYGALAPLVLIALQATQVVVAPVPGQILAVVAGFLFGTLWGTLYNVIGITIGSTVAFWLARRFGRTYVEGIVHDATLEKFDAIDEERALLTLFVLFLIPGLPDDVLCFAGGLTKIPLRQLVLIAVLGRAPAFFAANVVGDLLGTGRAPAALVLTAGILVVALFGYLHRDALVRRLGRDR